jgi:hypothetical protein
MKIVKIPKKDSCINGYDRIDRNNIDIIETNDL